MIWPSPPADPPTMAPDARTTAILFLEVTRPKAVGETKAYFLRSTVRSGILDSLLGFFGWAPPPSGELLEEGRNRLANVFSGFGAGAAPGGGTSALSAGSSPAAGLSTSFTTSSSYSSPSIHPPLRNSSLSKIPASSISSASFAVLPRRDAMVWVK